MVFYRYIYDNINNTDSVNSYTTYTMEQYTPTLPCLYCNNIVSAKNYGSLKKQSSDKYPLLFIDQDNQYEYIICSTKCDSKVRLNEY
jgi:hypothetical protein